MSITLYYNNLHLSNLSPDFATGVILGIFTVTNNYTLQISFDNQQVSITDETTIPFLINSSRFNSYIIYTNINPQEFDTVSIPSQRLMWWLKNQSNTYNLVSFETKDFINGIISICNYLNTDFRNYIAGPPFYMNAGVKVYQYISGYDIPLYVNHDNKHHAKIFPYYTGLFEDDPNASDWI